VLLPGARSSGGSPGYLPRAVSPPPAVEMWLPRRAPWADPDLPFPSVRGSGYDGELPCFMARWSSIRGTRWSVAGVDCTFKTPASVPDPSRRRCGETVSYNAAPLRLLRLGERDMPVVWRGDAGPVDKPKRGLFAKHRHIDGGLQTRCTCPKARSAPPSPPLRLPLSPPVRAETMAA
jgi:hypothetical protein